MNQSYKMFHFKIFQQTVNVLIIYHLSAAFNFNVVGRVAEYSVGNALSSDPYPRG